MNLDIPIHVDAASAGFILPFSSNGSEIPFKFTDTHRVRSINVSNHKYGMTYPGMGSVIFRDSSVVDPLLVYHITYLGGNFTDYTVNFSRGASVILLQYYNYLRFGRSGYQSIIDNCLEGANAFLNGVMSSATLGKMFQNLSDAAHLPIVVLSWAEGIERPLWNLTDLSDELRMRGWIVPAYVLPKTSPEQVLPPDKGTPVLRVVVQQKVSREKLNQLITDIEDAVERLNKTTGSRTSRLIYKGGKC